MASRRALTGGTGDVNPQFISFNVVQSGNDAVTTLPINVPVQRLSNQGRAQILEVLCVKYDSSNYELDEYTAQRTYEYVGFIPL
jgi:hypothetical protein